MVHEGTNKQHHEEERELKQPSFGSAHFVYFATLLVHPPTHTCKGNPLGCFVCQHCKSAVTAVLELVAVICIAAMSLPQTCTTRVRPRLSFLVLNVSGLRKIVVALAVALYFLGVVFQFVPCRAVCEHGVSHRPGRRFQVVSFDTWSRLVP